MTLVLRRRGHDHLGLTRIRLARQDKFGAQQARASSQPSFSHSYPLCHSSSPPVTKSSPQRYCVRISANAPVRQLHTLDYAIALIPCNRAHPIPRPSAYRSSATSHTQPTQWLTGNSLDNRRVISTADPIRWAPFIGLVVVVVFCAAAWFLSPKGENQTYVH